MKKGHYTIFKKGKDERSATVKIILHFHLNLVLTEQFWKSSGKVWFSLLFWVFCILTSNRKFLLWSLEAGNSIDWDCQILSGAGLLNFTVIRIAKMKWVQFSHKYIFFLNKLQNHNKAILLGSQVKYEVVLKPPKIILVNIATCFVYNDFFYLTFVFN